MKTLLAAGLLVAMGCSKRQDSTAPALPFGDAQSRLSEALPAGASVLVYTEEGRDGELLYEATWSRPGFPSNSASFMVRKMGPSMTVKCSASGEWVYESGKLKEEKVLSDDVKRWEWAKARAQEIADATYRVSK